MRMHRKIMFDAVKAVVEPARLVRKRWHFLDEDDVRFLYFGVTGKYMERPHLDLGVTPKVITRTAPKHPDYCELSITAAFVESPYAELFRRISCNDQTADDEALLPVAIAWMWDWARSHLGNMNELRKLVLSGNPEYFGRASPALRQWAREGTRL